MDDKNIRLSTAQSKLSKLKPEKGKLNRSVVVFGICILYLLGMQSFEIFQEYHLGLGRKILQDHGADIVIAFSEKVLLPFFGGLFGVFLDD